MDKTETLEKIETLHNSISELLLGLLDKHKWLTEMPIKIGSHMVAISLAWFICRTWKLTDLPLSELIETISDAWEAPAKDNTPISKNIMIN